jgi:Family of unknown function (DUF5996)
MWPRLSYTEWKPTYETLHRWLQIVGKLRLSKSPWANHSWNTTLYLTSRGLSTSAIPLVERNLTVDLDFINHKLIIQDSQGKYGEMPLKEETVSSFYRRFIEMTEAFGVKATFEALPNELPDATPFASDMTHGSYHPQHAYNCFQVFVRVSNVFQEWRADFVGKCSPVHFFWGSFDLAVTRFSGRRAPEHPGGIPHLSDEVVKEAYSHEVMSCGFWPGNELYPHAAFYAYTYPEPEGFSLTKITPPKAFYHPGLREYILDYESVRKSIDPAGVIRNFMDSSYLAAANLGRWDRDILEVSPHLMNLKKSAVSYFADQATRQ